MLSVFNSYSISSSLSYIQRIYAVIFLKKMLLCFYMLNYSNIFSLDYPAYIRVLSDWSRLYSTYIPYILNKTLHYIDSNLSKRLMSK